MKDALSAQQTKCCRERGKWERGGNQEVFSGVVTLELGFKDEQNFIREERKELEKCTRQRDELSKGKVV